MGVTDKQRGQSAQNASDDGSVLEALEMGSLTAGEIAETVVWAENGSDRRLDRSLQRLRRAGRIRFGSPRWHLVRQEEDADA